MESNEILYKDFYIENSNRVNYSGKILLLNPRALKPEYRDMKNLYFYAQTGFGCDPEALGTKVFGVFIIDGEHSAFRRYDFLGVADLRYAPAEIIEVLKNDYMKVVGYHNDMLEQEAENNAD